MRGLINRHGGIYFTLKRLCALFTGELTRRLPQGKLPEGSHYTAGLWRLFAGMPGRHARRPASRGNLLARAIKATCDPLEPRVLLSSNFLYVNNNWMITADSPTDLPSQIGVLSAGDTVSNGNAGDDGALSGLIYGTDAFKSIADALATDPLNKKIVVVSGTYFDSATITTGVTVQGWASFATQYATGPNPESPSILNQANLQAFTATVDAAQIAVNDTTTGDSVAITGLSFAEFGSTGGIRLQSTNRASVTISGNNFVGNSATSTAVQVDAGKVLITGDNSISGSVGTGILVTNGVATLGGNISGTGTGIAIQGGAVVVTNATVTGATIGLAVSGSVVTTNSSLGPVYLNGNTTGIALTTSLPSGQTTIFSTSGGLSISGGVTGLDDSGALNTLSGSNPLAGAIFTGQSGNYIALSGSAPGIDATGASFGTVTPSDNALADIYGVEDKISDVIDGAGVGLVRVRAGKVFVTQASETGSNGAIQRGINAASNGDEIHIQAGTFKENITVGKGVHIMGANAGVSGTASRNSETIIMTNGNQSDVITVTASGVTIDGVLINGNDPLATGGTLASGDDSNALYGIHATSAVSNLTIENNIIQDVYIGFRGDAANAPVSGNTISANWFNSIGTFDFGYAVDLLRGFYADVTDNLMTRVWTGVHTNDFHVAGPAVWSISDNVIHSYATGIAYWLNYSAATGATISGNTISAETGATANNFGILVVSLQDAVNTSFTGNSISGTDYGIGVFNAPTTHTVTIDGTNSITGTKLAGVLLSNDLETNPVGTTNFLAGGPGAASTVNITGLSITPASGVGVKVVDSATSFHTAQTVVISNSTINGSGTVGVQIQGTMASASISGTTLGGFATGVEDNGGSLTLGAGDNISGGTTGLRATLSTAAIAGDTLGNLTFNGQSGNYIELAGSALNGAELNATGATFDGETGPTNTLDQNFALDDRILDALDDASPLASRVGFIRIKSGNVFVTPASASIQRGVDASIPNDTVHVENGNYTESNITIGHALTVSGESQAGVVITPAGTDSHDDSTYGGTAVQGFIVNTGNVAINTLTIDGGAGENYRQGIIADTDDGWTGGLTIDQVTIDNIDRKGIAMYGRFVHTTGDSVSNSTFDHIDDRADASFEAGFAIAAFASDVTITNNTITNSGIGIGTNDLNNTMPAGVATISGNTITSPATGTGNPAVGMDLSGLAGGSVISHNTITLGAANAGGIAAILQYTEDPAGGVVFSNNLLTTAGGQTGVLIYQSQDPAHPFIVANNTISGTAGDTAILATDDGTIFGETAHVGTTYATITGNQITGVSAGIDLESAGTTPVSAIIGGPLAADSNSIDASGTGILVHGAHSSATISGNISTITGAAIGVDIEGGSASLSNNRIDSNGIGVKVAAGGSLAGATGNFIVGNTTGIEVAADAGSVGAIRTNDLSGNVTAIDNESTMTVDASLNWWGTTDESAIQGLISGVAHVDYTPWLDSGDADGVTPGFQASTSVLHVGAGGAQSGAVGRIQEGLNDLSAAGTLHVDAGTYAESATVSQAATILGPNAGIDPNGASPRNAEAIVGNAGVAFNITSDGVAIDGLTLTGSVEALGASANGLTVANSIFNHPGAFGVRRTGGASRDSIDITDDEFVAATTAIRVDDVTGAISGNVISGAKTGIALSNASNLTVSGNTISGLTGTDVMTDPGIGIRIDASGSGISVTGNSLDVAGTDNIGVVVSDTTGVQITGNVETSNGVQGFAGVIVTDNGAAYGGTNGAASATISGNQIDNIFFGVGIDGSGTATTSATISANNLTSNATSVFVEGANGSISVSGNAIAGSGKGVLAIATSSATITNNSISGSTTGVEFDDDSTGSLSGNRFDAGASNVTDLNLSTTGAVTVSGDHYAASSLFIDNENPNDLDATAEHFNTSDGATIEAKIHDKLDDSSLGLVTWNTNDTLYVTPGDSIQAAIDVAGAGWTIVVSPGTYVEDSGAGRNPGGLWIDKPLTIEGAGSGLTIVEPGESDPLGGNPNASLNGGVNLAEVVADNVTLEGMTLDGNNPSISSGVLSNGTDVDARNGIIVDYNAGVFNNLNVNHVTVQNIYLRGIYASSGGTFNFSNNTVINVAGSDESIGIFNFGGSGIVQNNTVSQTLDAIASNWSTGVQFLDNTVTQSGSGIHTDNSSGLDVISGNDISDGTPGAYGIFSFVPYSHIVISNNSISGVAVGLAAFGGMGGDTAFSGNNIDETGVVGGTGAYVTTDTLGFGQMNVSASFNGDSYTGGDTGIQIQQNAGATAAASISGETINDPAVGIDVSGGNATITGNHIFNNGIGVKFENTGSGSVDSNNFDGGSVPMDNGTDVQIAASAGAVTVTNNTMAANTFFIDLNSTQNIDASTNTFLNAADNFRIEDKMHHRVDTDLAVTNGLITWNGNNVYVTDAGTDHDIQRGIDAAAAEPTTGWTVNVEGGTYTLANDLSISKGVTLSGPNASISASGNAVRDAEAVVDGGAARQLLISTTDPVTVQGLELTGLNLMSYTAAAQISYVNDIIADLPGNIFTNAPATFTMTGDHVYGTADTWDILLLAGNWNGTIGTYADIENNLFNNVSTTSTATGLNLSNVQGIVSGNTFQDIAYYAVLLANDSGISLTGNTFGDIYNPDPTSFPATGAIRFYTPGTAVDDSITDNHFEGSYSGIAVRQGSVTDTATITIAGNTFTGNTYDIINLGSAGLAPAGDNVFDGVTLSSATLPDLYAISDKVVDGVDIAGVGLVRLKAGNVYVTPNSFYNPNSGAIVDTTTPSIQRGIDAATAGDVVNVEAGTYNENVVLNKAEDLEGAGSSVAGSVIAITTGDGIDMQASNATVSGFRIVGNGSAGTTAGLYFNAAVSGDDINDVVATDHEYGVEVHNAAVVTDLTLTNSSLINSDVGFRVSSTGEVIGMTADHVHFDGNVYGLYTTAAGSGNVGAFSDNLISNASFDNNVTKGVYLEKIDNSTFNGFTVASSGFAGSSPNGFDINAKNGAYTNITVENGTVSGTSTSNVFVVDGNSPVSGLALVNLNIGVTTNAAADELGLWDSVSGVTMSGVQIHGNALGLGYSSSAGPLNIGDTSFDGSLTAYIINGSTFAIDATQGASFNGFVSGAGTVPTDLPSYYAIEDKIVDAIDAPGAGLVRLLAGHVFVTPNSFFVPLTSTPSIQRGINAATTGDEVDVEAGTYSGDVNVNKRVTLDGAQAGVAAPGRSGAESIIQSPDGTTELQISVSNATVNGFTIQGNTNQNVFGPGVYMIPGISGTHVENNVIQDNIIGLDLVNTSATDQAFITGNLFQDNTNPGASSGNDIYADQSTAGVGGVNNVLISDNTFTNSTFAEDSWGIGMSNTDATPFDGIQVTGNTFTESGRGMYFYGSSNVTITNNSISGATHYGIGLFSSGPATDSAFTITGNALSNNGAGIELEDGAAYVGPLTLSGNSYTTGGGQFSIYNDSTTPIDASGETINGVLAGTATTAQEYAIVDTIVDGVDAPGLGLVRLKANNVYVTTNSFNTDLGTTAADIQRAVDVASPGDTVNIGPGHFVNQVTIDGKDLSLVGSGAGTTFIDAPASLTVSFTTSADNRAIVTFENVDAGNISDLTIEGLGNGNANNRFVGLGYRNAGGTADSLVITGIRNNPLNGVQAGVAIYADADNGTARSLTVSNNMVTDYQKNGMALSGSDLTVNVFNNTVSGVTTPAIAQNGIQVGYGASGTVSGNVVMSQHYTGPGAESDGILIYDAGTVLVTGNLVTDNDAGIDSDGSTTTITQNTITGNNYGVELWNANAGSSVSANFIANNSATGIFIDTSVTDSVAIFNNSITGNSAGLNNMSLVTQNASSNWWGSTHGPQAAANLYDSAATGNSVFGPVTIAPWLSSGTDVAPATPGFQPSPPADTTVPSLSTPATQSTTEGAPTVFNIGTLADTFSASGDWHFVINWGDSTLQSFYSSSTTNPLSHTYTTSTATPYHVIVTVADGSGNTGGTSFDVTVADAAVTGSTTATAAGTEGIVNSSALSGATFTDANPGDHTADFSATIHWGDGNMSAGVISYNAGTQTYTVDGSHTYVDEGTYGLTIDIADVGGATAAITGSANVADAALTGSSVTTAGGTEGSANSSVLSGATFTDANPGDHTGDFTATINWGDGNLSSGTISFNAGTYTIAGTHTYASFGSYSISIAVQDDGGSSATVTGTATVANVAPSNLNLLLSSNHISENQSTQLSGSFTDPGTGNTHTVDISWGDSSPDTVLNLPANTLFFSNVSHQYLNNPAGLPTGSFPIHVTVTDNASTSTFADTSVEVDNVAPSGLNLTLSSNHINENDNTTLSGSFTDPGTLDTHMVDISWGDGSSDTILNLPAGQLSLGNVAHQYLNNAAGHPTGSFPITVTVTDSDSAFTSANSSVEVDNVAPAGLSVSATGPINENASTSLSGSFTDPGTLDSHTVTITWGDSSPNTVVPLAAGVLNFSGVSHQYLNNLPGNAPYSISVSVTDSDGASTSGGTTLVVNDVPPTADVSSNATSVNEGSLYTLTIGNVTDPGTQDVISGYQIVWGDGSHDDFFSSGSPASTVHTHTYTNGPANDVISVNIVDNDGPHGGSGVVNLTVNNVNPIASFGNFGSVNEGSSATVIFTGQFDPSSADTAAGLHYAYDFNNDGTFDVGTGFYAGSSAASSFAVPASFLLTPGPHVIKGRIIDQDNGFTDYTTTIMVENVAPTVSVPASVGASAGSPINVLGTFTDPGTQDGPWTGMVNFGDGSGLQSLTISSSSNAFTLNHNFTATGTYTVNVLVTDHPSVGPSLTGTASMLVTVSNTTLQVTHFAQTPSGFDFTFNHPIQIGDLALYGSSVSAQPVTVVGASAGALRGSVVWDASSNTLHWVQTYGVLTTDSYTITLVSGTTGDTFHDQTGNALDGNGDNTPGDNFVDVDSVTAPSGRILSMPDFARGPTQPVNVALNGTASPDNINPASGLPISISDGTSVTAVDFELDYNPALLSISAVNPGADLPGTWSITANNNSVSGVLLVSVSGGTALPSGMQSIISLAATVPSTALYGASEMLNLTNIRVNEGNIPAAGDEAIHKAMYFGDASGDGHITGFDASLVSSVVVHLQNGFNAAPLTDPRIIADTTGDHTLSGLDASYIAQKAVHSSVPNIPDPGTVSLTMSGVDPTVEIGSLSQTASFGSTIPILVSIIDNASGLVSADFAITYSPLLTLSDSDVSLSNYLHNQVPGWNYNENVDVANHEVYLTAYTQLNKPLGTGSADLFVLNFHAPASGTPGATANVTMDLPNSAGLNEGQLTMTAINGSVTIENQVVNRETFYNNSAFDGNSTANSTSDDAAIATDKSALLPGNTATFTNYTSYDKGINGIMVDVAGAVGPITASDFTFRTGNDNNVGSWNTLVATPTINVRTLAGGISRIDVTFPDGTIVGKWLQVTLKADANTGLAANDVSYFGNAPAESGNSSTNAQVSAIDEIGARQSPAAGVGVTNPFDYNRDGAVNPLDEAVAAANYTNFLNALNLIQVPVSFVLPAAVTNAISNAVAGTAASAPATGTPATSIPPAPPVVAPVTAPVVATPGVAPALVNVSPTSGGGGNTGGHAKPKPLHVPTLHSTSKRATGSLLKRLWDILG